MRVGGLWACALLAAGLLHLSHTAAAAEAAAPELTHEDFDSTLASKTGSWLLDFYAPWCGHCKKISPIWDEAAEKVAAEGLAVHFAKMDCTVRAHSDICERYKVSGFPTLRVISSEGTYIKNFRGGRDVDGVVAYAKKLAAPSFKELKTTKEVKEFIELMEAENGAAFILFKPEEPGEGYKELETAFKEAAIQQSDVAEMAVAPEYTGDDLGMTIRLDARTLQEDDGLGGKLAVFREGVGKCMSTAINRTTAEVSHWIDGHRFTMMPKITSKNYKALGDRGKPLVIVILRGAKKKTPDGELPAFEKIPINAEYLATMKGVAKDIEDDFAFGYLDGKEWEMFVVKYGITTRVLPRLLIMDLAKEYFLPVPVDIKGHEPTSEYLAKVKSGEVKFSRNFETMVREILEVYKWQLLTGFLAIILLPIGWMMWTDHADRKRAATYAKAKLQ